MAAAAALIFVPAQAVEASGIESRQLSIDFSKPEEAAGLARWSHADVLRCRPEGLGWDGSKGALQEASLMVTKALAVGNTWWAPTNAGVQVQFEWKGADLSKHMGYVYVRHSPDLVHWSDWTNVPRFQPKADPAKHIHNLNLNRPRPDAEAWHALVRTHTAGKPELRLTAHAATAAWAATHRPDYLARVKPFFGYLQIRFEGNFRSRQYLKSMSIRVSHVVPGPSYPRPLPGEDPRDAHTLHWNHRGPGAEDPQRSSAREGTRRAVLGAALDALQVELKGAGLPETGPFQQVTLCGRTAFGDDLMDLDLGSALPRESPFGEAAAEAWADALRRNQHARLVPGSLPSTLRVHYRGRYGCNYVLRGGRRERANPESTWARFHSRHKNSLGIVWVTEPGLDAEGTRALVHLSRANGPRPGTGRWYLMAKSDTGWRVEKKVATGKR